MLTTATLSLFLLCQPALESRTMSEDHPTQPLFTYLDQLWEAQRARHLNHGRAVNINAIDEFDPVHLRIEKERRDFDHDGDLGREHDDYCRDNGIGYGSSGLGAQRQIGGRLPVVEAPSIVPEQPQAEPVAETKPTNAESEG